MGSALPFRLRSRRNRDSCPCPQLTFHTCHIFGSVGGTSNAAPHPRSRQPRLSAPLPAGHKVNCIIIPSSCIPCMPPGIPGTPDPGGAASHGVSPAASAMGGNANPIHGIHGDNPGPGGQGAPPTPMPTRPTPRSRQQSRSRSPRGRNACRAKIGRAHV